MVMKHNHFHADRQTRQTAHVEPLMTAETHVQRIFVVLIVSRKARQTCSAPQLPYAVAPTRPVKRPLIARGVFEKVDVNRL